MPDEDKTFSGSSFGFENLMTSCAHSNKILHHYWFPGSVFVMYSARDHIGVQLQESNLNLL